jgi:RNA polymerase sigma-70 factor (ECF subfamily)
MHIDSLAAFDIEPEISRLHGIARRFLGSDDLAWDAVQDALVCLCDEPVEPRDVRGWLVRTVVHKSLHHARALARRRHHEEVAARFRAQFAAGDEPDGELDLALLRECVENAIAALPPRLREAARLREIEQLGYGAIAQRLALPLGTVRSRLSRARALLRVQLAGLAHDERLCFFCARERRVARAT